MRIKVVLLSLAWLAVAQAALAVPRAWTGAVSGSWSEPGNWSPAGVPAAGEALVFPAGVTRTTMTNDLPAGFAVGAVDFKIGYTLNGNALTLNGDWSFDQATYPWFYCNVDLKLGANVKLGAAINSEYKGAIDVNGKTLTVDTYNTTFKGPFNGSGSILLNGSGASINSSGNFSGPITGVADIVGAMPNASISGVLSGSGTVGAVTIGAAGYSSGIYLGTKQPCCGDLHSIGTLNTKSISIGGPFHYDLVPGGTSDRLVVTGSVTIGSASLDLFVPAGSPSTGQKYTLIDNDGADAVSGTFTGYPEGATVTLGTTKLSITYQGGDGNDVVLTVLSSKKSWTGASSALWSDGGNWSPAGAPTAGEALVFPAGVTRTVMTNDLPSGFTVGAMDFKIGYTINGNPLTLTGDLTFDQGSYPNFVVNADLKLGASIRLGAAITSEYKGAIDVNGQTLTIDPYNTIFKGPINGSGAIVVNSFGTRIASSGNFSGTISGIVDVVGSMPNATVSGGLSGSGTIGPVTTTGAAFYLGAKDPCCGDTHTFGTLNAKSVSIGGPFYVDLSPGSSSDRLVVTGSVALGGKSLVVSVPNGWVFLGNTYTLIDNDGSDAVTGSFDGLPEGAVFPLGNGKVSISYHGGDGNDVVLFTVAANKAWNGANSNLWSNPNNWSPSGLPASGETLLFPGYATHLVMTNDLPAGTIVGPLSFENYYHLGGNALTLKGDWTFDHSAYTDFVCYADLKLGANVKLGAANTSEYTGAIDVNGQTLTVETYNTTFKGPVNGTGSIVLTGSGLSIASSGNFTGTIHGVVDLVGSMPNAAIEGGLSGNGTVGAVTITNALYPGTKSPCCGDPHIAGTLNTKSVSIGGPMFYDVIPSGTPDLLKVTGSVTLGGKAFAARVPTGAPLGGQIFLVIDNDGSDPVGGTFEGLPEGGIVIDSPWKFRISYVGGSGNDVTLTTVDGPFAVRAKTTVTLTLPTPPSIVYGDPAAISVSVRAVDASQGTPTGNVTLKVDGASSGIAALSGGDAAFSASGIDAGAHSIVASYGGDTKFEPGDSASSQLTVRKAPTTIEATATVDPASPGRLTLAVSVIASNRPTVIVPGVVEVIDGSTKVQQPLVGRPTMITLSLASGDHPLVIRYLGTNNYDSSTTNLNHNVPQPRVSASDVAIVEGDAGEKTASVTVELSSASAENVLVPYATEDGTAKAGEDYRAVAGTLTFAPGEVSKTIGVPVYGDTKSEDDETLRVTLGDPVGAIRTKPFAKVTITNDDLAYRSFLGLIYTNTPAGSLTLDLYTPASGNGPFPVILWIPGTTAYDSAAAPPPLRETGRGYAVAVARYRAATVSRFPAQIDDLRNAIRWLRANAAQYQLDSQRTAAWGSSAGAHLAALLGTMNDSARAVYSGRVQAVIAWGAATDLLRLESDASAASCTTSFDDWGSPQSTLIGCALQTCQQNASDASPLSYVSGDDPPFLIMHGQNDCVVPLAQSRRLYDALRAVNVPVTFQTIAGGPPATWTSLGTLLDVESFLDTQLKASGRQRSVRK